MNDTISFTGLDSWRALNTLGYSIMGVLFLVAVARETIHLFRGKAPDYRGAVVRLFVGCSLLWAVPSIATVLGNISLAAYGMFQNETLANFEHSFQVVLGSGGCEDLDWMDKISVFFSFRGLTLVFGFVVLFGFLIIKIAVIDVAWKVVFALVLFQAPITLSLATLEELGSFSGYFRTVLSVAVWPLTFGLIMTLTVMAFPETLTAVANGGASISCVEPALDLADENDSSQTAELQNASQQDVLTFIKFLGIVVALAIFTWKIPDISSAMVGAGPSGPMGTTALAAIAVASASRNAAWVGRGAMDLGKKSKGSKS